MALARALTGRLLVLLLVGGCSGGTPNTAMPSDAPAPGVTTTPSTASAAASTAAASASAEPEPSQKPSLVQESFTLGGVTLVVSAASVAVTVPDDGTVAVDLTLSPDSPAATVAVEGAGSLEAGVGHTLLILNDAGAPTAAAAPPEAAGAPAAAAPPEAGPPDGQQATVRMRVPDPTHAELELIAAGDRPASRTVRLVLADRALESASWGEREGGRSLAVVPTAWARGAGAAGLDLLWSELVAIAPDADNQSMHDQLRCHALGAPDKASWNLEPWRPDVGLVSVLAAGCNP